MKRLCVVLCLLCSPVLADDFTLHPVEQGLLQQVNAERARYGLPLFQIDKRLQLMARQHCSWMANAQSMTHSSMNVAENIAMGQPDHASVTTTWMNSSGHRANILNGGHRFIGVCGYVSPSGQIFWCQQFTGYPLTPPEPEPKPIVKNVLSQPVWIDYQAVTTPNPSLGNVLADIESHIDYQWLQRNGISTSYRNSDRATWGHETTHGIHSILRNLHQANGRKNAFYVLNNRAIILPEPPVTLGAASMYVPYALRGATWDLYMVQGRQQYENQPLNICDEWVAYTNGTEVGLDLKLDRSESAMYMLEAMVNAFGLAAAIDDQNQAYDDAQFKAFVVWNANRNMQLIKRCKSVPGMHSQKQDAYLKLLMASTQFTNFLKRYFGTDLINTISGS